MGHLRFEVISPGQMTTIQDGGRAGYRSYGIPRGGFMDQLSGRQANIIVGNPEDSTLIEMIRVGASIQFDTEATIAITGADMNAKINKVSAPSFTAINIYKGDLLEFGEATENMVTYLAVAGTWQVDKVLESTSTFLRAKIGGLQGRQLQKGDTIAVAASKRSQSTSLPEHQIRAFKSGRKVRLIKSAESNDEVCCWLENTTFSISSVWDRMGIRLIGSPPDIPHQKILSSPVTVGTIQLPPDGQPIIIMADGQTTGGYPRVATVIKADLPYLAQQQPNSPVSFKMCSHAEAIDLLEWQ